MQEQQELTAEVRSLGGDNEDPRHPGIVLVLRRLADTLQCLPGFRNEDVAKIWEAARHLEESALDSFRHADLVKQGLAATLRALLATEPTTNSYREAIATLGRIVSSLRADRPLREQSVLAADALRAATNAVYLAAGGDPPFAKAPGEVAAGSARSVERQAAQARGALLDLAKSSWSDVRAACARALFSLADMVEAADVRRVAKTQVSGMRFQAERLSGADLLSVGQSEWLEAGLLAALDALDLLQREHTLRSEDVPAEHDGIGGVESVWSDAARQAVAGLQERDSLAFQAGVIQDAFRATLDAFVAVSEPAWLDCASTTSASNANSAGSSSLGACCRESP